MTNQTSSSWFSTFEPFYQHLVKPVYEVISDNAYGKLSKISEVGGLPAKALVCSYYPNECALEFAGYVAYQVPKAAFETTVSWAFLEGKKFSAYALKQGSAFFPTLVDESFTKSCSDFYGELSQKALNISMEATAYVTNKSLEEIEKNVSFENKNIDLGESFKAVDLIGPSLLMGFCARKALENFQAAASSAYYLISGKRTVAQVCQIPVREPHMVTDNIVSFSHTTVYTAKKLLVNTIMEVAFTALWGAGTYLTYQGIYDAVEKASNSSEQAASIAQAILIANVVVPRVWNWIQDFMTDPPASYTNDDQGPSSSLAPHLYYVGTKGSGDPVKEANLPNIDPLEFEKAVAYLNKAQG